MKLTREEVEYVAKLARLRLTEEEKEQMASKLGAILEYIGKLNELDTSNVEPTFHVLDMKNVFREDEVTGSFPQEEILANAPQRIESFFGVPRIL